MKIVHGRTRDENEIAVGVTKAINSNALKSASCYLLGCSLQGLHLQSIRR